MQIVEKTNEGLKRAYAVTIPASEILQRIDGEVKRIAPQVRLPGFRPGKVPANLIRKMHGAALHQDALNSSIRDAMNRLVAEHELRPAMQPQIELAEGYEEGKDVELSVSLEVLPSIEAPSLEGLKLEKLVVPVSDEDVEEAIQRLASQQKRFVEAKKGRKAQPGDQVICDYVGRIDGVEFEGGKGEKQAIELGAGRLIPGFEEGLVGVKAGEVHTISVTFPEDFPAGNLRGKDATFEVTVHEVKVPAETVVNDDFAKELGLEGLEQLRSLVRGQLEQEIAGLTRTQMKRALLDQLAAAHDFEVPASMVEAEFAQIWQQLVQEAGREQDPQAALSEIESERDEYRAIAERRVRLGLLLSEIGRANGVEVTQQEMSMLIQQAAQQYRPEDRNRFIEFIRSEPMAAAQLRAPLYEDKVIDFLIGKAEITERKVTREELQAAIEAEAEDTSKKAPARKKAAAKKPAAAQGEDKPAARKKPAAKKAAAAEGAAGRAESDADPAGKPAASKRSAARAAAAEDAAQSPARRKAPARKSSVTRSD